MNLRLHIASAIILGVLLSLPMSAQVAPPTIPFSGDLQIVSSTGENIQGKIYFTPKHIRFDMHGDHGEVILITTVATETADMLLPAQHMYMEVNAKKAREQNPSLASGLKPLRDANNPCADEAGTTCKKVGVEQINGRTCDRWQITRKDRSVSTVWIDQRLHFPIKTDTKGDTWQLTNIVEGEPAANLFVIPSGYRKFDVTNAVGRGQRPAH